MISRVARLSLVRSGVYCLYLTIAILFVIFVVPLLVLLVPECTQFLIFQNPYAPCSFKVSDHPGITGRNMYLSSTSAMIPVWHLLPSTVNCATLECMDNELSKPNSQILFYIHDSDYERCNPTLIAFYKKFTTIGYNVISFDYSGFAENMGAPNGKSASYDTIEVFQYVRSMSDPTSKIVIWMHGFGNGVGLQAFEKFSSQTSFGSNTKLVVESSFYTFESYIQDWTIYKVFLSWYPHSITKPLLDKTTAASGAHFQCFKSLNKVASLGVPIVHMHAIDDKVINYQRHGMRIKTSMMNAGANYKFLPLNSSQTYGHSIGVMMDVNQALNA